MNKSILWLIGLLFVTSLSIVSCSETDGTEDPYANWEERNQRYIDSIATVAEAEAMEKGNGKSSVPINFHLWD
jgi:FKBP-type peptidyl-prolyl cis-trans isomerase FklB